MEGCTNREGIFWKGLGRGRGSEGDDGNMAEPGRHLARKALRRRKPQAAGVNDRRGGLRRGDAVVLCKRRTARLGRIEATRKGIGKVMCGTPQSADADSSPYRGAFQAAVSPKPPLQGEVGAPEGADGGARCRLTAEISGKVRQGLAPCFVGDDAGIVPETLRRRQALRRAKSPALQITRKRAVMRKRQLSARSAGGPMRASAPTQGGRLAARKACATAASLSAGPFRPVGAGRSLIGRPGELLWDEKRGTTRHGPYGVANAAILGRPHLAPGNSQGDRGPLEPCPAPRN